MRKKTEPFNDDPIVKPPKHPSDRLCCQENILPLDPADFTRISAICPVCRMAWRWGFVKHDWYPAESD